MKTNLRKILVVVGLCAVMLAAGFGAAKYLNRNPLTTLIGNPNELRSGVGKFTNPLLDCELANGILNVELMPFGSLANKYIQNAIGKNDISDIALYFRDLNNGSWFGVRESDLFLPASLLKVPVMMTYFRAAEENPEVLKQNILFDKKEDALPPGDIQTILPGEEIKVGNTYTAEELIKRAIVYSDNQAVILLYKHLNQNLFFNLYGYLGVTNEVLKTFGATLSPKDYGKFFRILFNASFLNREYSEKALALLSKVEFRDGLVAGVPKEITVSHKFGEGGSFDKRQLHDCGIIYYPNRPYLLCIMTKGKNIDALKDAIKDISHLVYTEIDKQFAGQ